MTVETFLCFQCLDQLSSVAEDNTNDAVPLIREYLMSVAKEATAGESREALRPLPRSLEKYVAYCDILHRLLHLESFVWQTFVLQNYDAAVHNASFDFRRGCCCRLFAAAAQAACLCRGHQCQGQEGSQKDGKVWVRLNAGRGEWKSILYGKE